MHANCKKCLVNTVDPIEKLYMCMCYSEKNTVGRLEDRIHSNWTPKKIKNSNNKAYTSYLGRVVSAPANENAF